MITKALIPSTILTLIVAAAVGFTGSTGSFLHIQDANVIGHVFYWSWSFFFTVMALNGFIALRVAEREKLTLAGESTGNDGPDRAVVPWLYKLQTLPSSKNRRAN